MDIKAAEGKNVKITLNTGEVFLGVAYDYTSALDNEPDTASITIDHTELYEPEIKTIEYI